MDHPLKPAIADPELAVGKPVYLAQHQSDGIDAPEGSYYCINENCNVNFFVATVKTKQTKRNIRCDACQTLICKKCNAAGHGMDRCNYECPKCNATNPLANSIMARGIKRYNERLEKAQRNCCMCIEPDWENFSIHTTPAASYTIHCGNCEHRFCMICKADFNCGHTTRGIGLICWLLRGILRSPTKGEKVCWIVTFIIFWPFVSIVLSFLSGV